MVLPALKAYTNEVCTSIDGDEQNTNTMWCNTFDDLRGFYAQAGMTVFALGQLTLNDGYQGQFAFQIGEQTDDNVNILTTAAKIKPHGYWQRVGTSLTPGTFTNTTVVVNDAGNITSITTGSGGGFTPVVGVAISEGD